MIFESINKYGMDVSDNVWLWYVFSCLKKKDAWNQIHSTVRQQVVDLAQF